MDCSYIIFLDESKFNFFGSNGQQYCWRRSGERFLGQHCQIWRKKYYGLRMHELGGSGQPLSHKWDLDKYIYCEILEMDLISTIHMHDLEEENVIFQ
jgi:hypothetical protein